VRRRAGDFVFLRGLSRSEGTTVIIVTHDASIAALSDRTLRLTDGRLDEVRDTDARP
jgi:predicted ABC-type transport system involved in lysophospholipase L1 biosynthesis ATPase subunit